MAREVAFLGDGHPPTPAPNRAPAKIRGVFSGVAFSLIALALNFLPAANFLVPSGWRLVELIFCVFGCCCLII